ncbi:MAG: aminopeptidase P family protein [Parasporobacterium sp.]|nr:aminopeptidase P family protein [Parasporobacterium sp.]
MPEMSLAGPRYKYPVSNAELNRRLDAVQNVIRSKGLDCAIAQTTSTIFDSVIRYMVDKPCHGYGTTLIIPAEGKMTMINHGFDNDDMPVAADLRNVEKLITKPYCQPFCCTDGLNGKVVAEQLKKSGYKKVGLILKQLITADTLDGIRDNIPDASFLDISREFSYIKAIKSEEEIGLIKLCVRAHEHLMKMVPALIRPGRMEYEVLADLEKVSRYMQCDYIGNIAVGSAAKGGGSNFFQNFSANRRIEMGDAVTVMIEVSGPGGIFGELARTFCLGEPDKDFAALYDLAKQAQSLVAEHAKPGITGAQLNEVFDQFVTSHGLPVNGRFVGHSQGYDMMEAPAICPTEDMELRENMFFAIHPELMRAPHFTIACDNYLITKNGAERVTTTPQEMTILEF